MVRHSRINRPLQWGIIAPPFSIVPSIGFNVSENVTAYLQLHYAKYREEDYEGAQIKPESFGSRLGVLLNF